MTKEEQLEKARGFYEYLKDGKIDGEPYVTYFKGVGDIKAAEIVSVLCDKFGLLPSSFRFCSYCLDILDTDDRNPHYDPVADDGDVLCTPCYEQIMKEMKNDRN